MNEVNNNVKWYIIHVYSGYEAKVKDNLLKMIENNNLQDYIFEVSFPVEEDIVEKNGKRKVVERKKFPGYVFVKMIYTDHIWYMVTNTRGVTGFVGPQGKAQSLTQEEIKRMGLEKISTEDFDIMPGDNVRVVSGALETFLGIVESVSMEKQKVKVIVQMFGRQTPVELDFNQIEKIN
ncbi:MAG TPA: transcription termination/antitermination protein NusG [Clostridia bacterium]|jgi:transcriptional antiterminator NusG|nr:transcription termination/antitermination protein NusG [Clostridia bacterium]